MATETGFEGLHTGSCCLFNIGPAPEMLGVDFGPTAWLWLSVECRLAFAFHQAMKTH